MIIRGAVGRNRHLKAGIHMVVGTAVATVTSGLLSAPDTFFSVTRQSVPLEAKDKMRIAKDEGYVRNY